MALEPGLEGSGLPCGNQRLDRSNRASHGLGELGTDQVPQGIGGEIADQPLKLVPVDLQVA
jgi:hypothetical protein